MRNAERGVRNDRLMSSNPAEAAAHPHHSAFRIPHSALVFLTACTPVTTRPAFLPYPEALVAVVNAPPGRVVPEATGWLTSKGMRVERSSLRDGYVEAAWFNVRSRRSSTGDGDPGELLPTVKLRCWVDPNVPGKSQLTVEAVYRPWLDPSRTERDLEVIAPQESEGGRLAEALLAAMKQRFGT